MKLITKKQITDNLPIIVPGIKEVFVAESPRPYTARVGVKLPWWKWFGLGLVHYYFRKKIEAAFCRFGAAQVLYIIDVS